MRYQQDSLYHFGIFGMKWGIRRYQNEDGTLTEEGKTRYSSRQKQLELAKDYARTEAEKDKKQLQFWNSEIEKSKNMPATKEGIKKRIRISDSDYEDYLKEYKTPERIKKSIVSDDQHQANTYKSRIKDWNKKLKELNKIKVDAISSDKQYRKQIDDVFSQSKGWLYRQIELYGLHSFYSQQAEVEDERRKKYGY